MDIKQIEQFSDIILRILQFRLESQSWNSFNSFPIVNGVSAGVPTPPDSGKTPQLSLFFLSSVAADFALRLGPDSERSG